jgi:hypothetical protein
MASAREFVTATEVKYYVLGDTNPYLLARVRWPDVAQAITAGLRDWQDDPGLFDLPYDPSSATVTVARADAIAAGWGVRLPSDATFSSSVPPLIRRMPANWSNLAPAEKRAWSLEFALTGRRAEKGRAHARRFGPGTGGSRRRRWRAAAVVERRHHIRMHVGGQARIRFGRRSGTVDLVDLGLGGLHCVVRGTQVTLETGGTLAPPLVLIGDTSENRIILDVPSTVTWQYDTGLGTHFGVAFGQLDDEQVEEVHGLLVTSDAGRGS